MTEKGINQTFLSFCDLRCSMCGHKEMERKRGKMQLPLFKKIIDEIAAFDVNTRVWMVFFGEALLLKKTTLFEMIRYAKEKGLTDVAMNSNANLLDDKAARELIASGLDAIYVGIDSFSEEVYSKIRVGGDYETVVENVRNLLRLKRELGRKTKPIPFVKTKKKVVYGVEQPALV